MKNEVSTIKRLRHYPLIDVDEPNLFREFFPYTEVPRIFFDFVSVPMSSSHDIFVTDTTFRDGQQARPPYTVEQIVDIYKLLNKLGDIVRQSEFFLYSEKDKEAVYECLKLGFRYPEITGWIRANKDDLKLVSSMNLKETGILTSVSDYHIFPKLNKTRKKALDDYLGIVKEALSLGITPRCHFEDTTRADFFGFVIPFAQELMKLQDEAKQMIKIRICDTMGYGLPYPEASIPRSVPKIIYYLLNEACVPSSQLEWHGHNDFHKGEINAISAWLYGCGAVNGVLLGFGERTGNTPIEALIIDYISLTKRIDINTTVITEIADYFKNTLSYHIPKNYPFVGDEFNVTRAGIHLDGLLKNEEIYNIFDTRRLLNRPPDVGITDKSGLSGIAHWINNYLSLSGESRIDKRHPGIVNINKWIEDEYKKGRQTSISNEEMLEQVKLHLPEVFESDFDILKKKAETFAAVLIEGFAEKKEIISMEPKEQERALSSFIRKTPFIQFIYVVNLSGFKITKNITRPEDLAKYKELKEEESFVDRDWFIKPLEDGKTFVSDFYTSKFTHRLCITVSSPIRSHNGEIVGILGADIMFEELAKLEEVD
ncbi:TPA: histone-lysine N-methyltransferase [bacterium]|nr:histone-lysine N-methyltransferase [bacterium]